MPNLPAENELETAPGRGAPAWIYWLPPALASWGYGLWLYSELPASVPVRWNFAGQVERYGGPLEAAFVLPVLLCLTAWLMLTILPRLLPSGAEYAPTRRTYRQLVGIVLCFMLYVQIVTSYAFRGVPVPLISLLTLGAGAMFVLMGNLLPKLQRNSVAGVRLPWTLRDDTVWVKSQRMAGWSFVILGLVLICVSQLPGYLPLTALLIGKFVVVAAVIWYSFSVSRRRPAAPAGD